MSIFGDIIDKISDLQLAPEPAEVREAIELRQKTDRMFFRRAASLTSTNAATWDEIPSAVAAEEEHEMLTDALISSVASG